MPLLHIVILAAIQGITEFLPISSSGHLILVRELGTAFGNDVVRGTPQQELIMDVAVHVGTLGAVLLYFWRDVTEVASGARKLALGRMTPGGRLALQLVIATIPIVVVGFLARDLIAGGLRSVAVIAWTTVGFGVLLLVSDRIGANSRRVEQLSHYHAVVIGCSQVLALIPGTSRSGITMTAARFLGYERSAAARYSLLLSIPAILGAGTLAAVEVVAAGDWSIGQDAGIAAVLSFLAALAAITFLMRWLRAAGFGPFVAYRLIIGAGLLVWLYL